MGNLSEQVVRKKSKPFILEMDTKKYMNAMLMYSYVCTTQT